MQAHLHAEGATNLTNLKPSGADARNRKRMMGIAVMLALLMTLALAWPGRGNKQWEALLADVPKNVSTTDAAINGVFYVLKQTHEPLFRVDNGHDYTSRLLRSWSRDLTYRHYTFCPDTSLVFIPGRKFSSEFFEQYISSITHAFNQSATVSKTGNCFNVRFNRPRKSYLDYLTRYQQAPTIDTDGPFEAGLGPFYAKTMTADEIRLIRKGPVSRGYDSILIHRYIGSSDPQLQNRRISDFNKISAVDIPDWVRSEQVGFQDVVLNTVTLVINHPDKKIRKSIYNCMDVDEFRRAFISQRKEFLDIQSVLPIGTAGAKPGRPAQTCPKRLKTSEKLIFANLRPGNEAELRLFFKDFFNKTGLRVEIITYPVPVFLELLKKTPRKYNLVVMSKDAVQSDQAPFLKYSHILDYEMPSINAKYEKMQRTDDPEKRDLLGIEIANDISMEYAVLPLYQSAREYHYPKGIKNLVVGRGFFEYPEVAELRW